MFLLTLLAYAPNKDTNIINFLNNLLTTPRKNNFDEEKNIIIGGDLNCTFNVYI